MDHNSAIMTKMVSNSSLTVSISPKSSTLDNRNSLLSHYTSRYNFNCLTENDVELLDEILADVDSEMQQLEYDTAKKCQLQMKRELIAQGKLQMHELAEQIILGWEDLSEMRLYIFGHYPDTELPQCKKTI